MKAGSVSTGPTPLPFTHFSVPGIRCAACISKLENSLPLQDGIVAARVNFTARRLELTHAPELSTNDLVAAIAKVGFDAQPMGNELRAPSSDDSSMLLKAVGVAGFAMMNIMLLSVSIWSGAEGTTRDLFHWLSAMIALPTVAYCGQPFFKSAWAALRHRRTNMDVPISIGVTLATALSLFETITHGPNAYFDGAVMLLFFLLCGRWLDSVMRDRARNGVSALLKTTARGALVLGPNGSKWRDADSLLPGMIMLVASGERAAADGVVTSGKGQFDLSLLTGESETQDAVVGTIVHAGTLNLGEPVRVRISAVGQDTIIADIARLMDQAAQGKSHYVRIADRAAQLYAPAVHLLALSSFIGWMLVGAGWHHSILIAVAVLIITCPCALGLAVPAAQIVTAGALMRAGVLVKDGSAIERVAEIDLAMFDKTGTLTLGKPVPTNLAWASAMQKSVMLALAQASRHPLSEALRRKLEEMDVQAAQVDEICETPGQGIQGSWAGTRVALTRPSAHEQNAGLAATCQIGGLLDFTVQFSDELRLDAQNTIGQLHRMGIESSIVSGDRASAVAPVARALGLTAQTSMLPQDKLDAIERQHLAGHRVLMVGDGLNDGPALAAGHASMAPSSASDAGQIAADMVFMGQNLGPVAIAVKAARKTQAVVRQNFALAVGYNVIAVPLALFGMVTPLVAALAMSGSSLIVVANALRLRGVAR